MKYSKLLALKKDVRAFVNRYYTTDTLIEVIGHVRNGTFTFSSCCCLIGVVTADHPLVQDDRNLALTGPTNVLAEHYLRARELPFARAAEDAYYLFGYATIPMEDSDFLEDSLTLRNRRLLPILLAELKRRNAKTKNVELLESAHR